MKLKVNRICAPCRHSGDQRIEVKCDRGNFVSEDNGLTWDGTQLPPQTIWVRWHGGPVTSGNGWCIRKIKAQQEAYLAAYWRMTGLAVEVAEPM